MKIIVTHSSPDMDAITSVWAIKRYLPGWEEAEVKFVPAGQRLNGVSIIPTKTFKDDPKQNVIEKIQDSEIIHVDTGMLPLDHHQTSDDSICGAWLAWEFAKSKNNEYQNPQSDHLIFKKAAISRIIAYVVQLDQFKEVFWPDAPNDRYDMSIDGILGGIQLEKPGDDVYLTEFIMKCLDTLLHTMENKISAEKDIAENGIVFQTQWGKGIGFETYNDEVIKLAQKIGYMIVVRKDPRKGYVRIKARPQDKAHLGKTPNVDLTPVHLLLSQKDPKATWFLHVSKKMLLNGTPKNPKMIPTSLSLSEIIEVLKTI